MFKIYNLTIYFNLRFDDLTIYDLFTVYFVIFVLQSQSCALTYLIFRWVLGTFHLN